MTAAILELSTPVGAQLRSTALVALQHLLPSITPLMRRFRDAGFGPERMFLCGKPYSTVPAVWQQLRDEGFSVFEHDDKLLATSEYETFFEARIGAFWKDVAARLPTSVDRVIVLDEGGWLRRELPSALRSRAEFVAVEHTMNGLFATDQGSPLPVVLMAASAAKTRFESPVIADSIDKRLLGSVPDYRHRSVGVIGLGNIGQAVARHAHQQGMTRISGFDIDPQQGHELRFLHRARDLPSLTASCEVLIGCTGRDVLQPRSALGRLSGPRWLASCSSGNLEFLAVARLLARRSTLRNDPFSDARGEVNDTDVTLLNGGFPLNFDRVSELEHPARIQLTRELTFVSVLQAALCIEPGRAAGAVMLDPEVQQALVQAWLGHGEASSFFPNWMPHGVEWWRKNSLGEPLERSLAAFVKPIAL